jgi:glutamate dehydrogenase/leucine dehydrogenase
VIGLGHVGERVARLLAAEGARVVGTDVVPERAVELPEGGVWVEPGEALDVACDVLAPCALGGILGPAEVERIRAQIVCGAANNVLSSGEVATELDAHDILYAPDFIVNAGGLVSVYGELRGLAVERSLELARGIEATMERILADADERWITPLAAAEDLALRRLADAAPLPAGRG